MTDWTRRQARWIAGALALALATAGCGEAAPTPSSAAAKERARAVLLPADQLPREYRVANGQEYPGEIKVCGTRLEPRDVRGFAMKRYTRTPVGPFLYQFVYVGNDAANRDLVHKVKQKAQTCSKDVVTTEEGKIVYAVAPLPKLPSYGQASTGFRLDPRSEGVSSEYLLIQRDNVLVLLFTVMPGGVSPPRTLLTSGAKAVTRQLSGGGAG